MAIRIPYACIQFTQQDYILKYEVTLYEEYKEKHLITLTTVYWSVWVTYILKSGQWFNKMGTT